jgi:hypothetical protein
MSYDLKRSHFSLILEKKVATGSVVTEEGVLLVASLDATTGEEVVDLSAGAANEVVAGFAIRDNADNATTSTVEEGTVPSSGTLEIQLDNNNLVASTPTDGSTSQLRVVASTSGALTLVDGSTPSAGQVANEPVTGLLTFNTAQSGEDVEMTYRYNLTVAESRLKFFQRNINNESGALFGQTGVGQGHGEVFTDQFDAQLDWSAGTAITSGASGQLVQGGSGTVLDARVISVPNVNNPLLGIAFDLGGSGA